MRSPGTPFMRAAMASNASVQVAGRSFPSRFTQGRSSRRRFSPSKEKRPRSCSHSSLTSSLVRGWMRSTSPARVSTRMFTPVASSTSTLSVLRSSHGRDAKA